MRTNSMPPHSAIMSTNSPNLWRILSETERIISANFRHFLALSVLFLFPIELATTKFDISPMLPSLSEPDSVDHSQYRGFLYLLVLVKLCAISSITHSTFHGFHGTPVGFISSLKSIADSFFPLIATTFVYNMTLLVILFAVGIFLCLGFDMDRHNIYCQVYFFLVGALLLGAFFYLQVELYLTNVVVVVESQWGYGPLRRSSNLMEGMKRTVSLIMLFFGIMSILLSIWWGFILVATARRNNNGWWVDLSTVVYAGFSTMLCLCSLAAQTVVFVYCKALHGELEFRIDGDMGGDLEFKIDDESGKKYGPLHVDVV